MDRCDMHDMLNCADCTGVTAQHQASLKETPDWTRRQNGELPSLPYIPNGPTIYSKFAGNCAGCGRRYPVDEPIHYDREVDGWIGVGCCAAVA